MFSKPAIPCLDYSGVVVDSTLAHVKTGQLLFGKTEFAGALAEYIVVGKQGCVPVPNDVTLKDAACVGVVGLTAYQSIVPYVARDSRVFINGGSGGTGTFGIQIAKALGCHVTASCSAANIDLCKSLGADEVIDYQSRNIAATLAATGTQFDLVVDNVFASPALYWNSHTFLREGGRYICVGGTPSLGFAYQLLKIYLWPRLLGGGQRPFQFTTVRTDPLHYEAIAKMMEEGKVKVVIEREFDLDQAAEAFGHLKTGRTKGKIVVKVCEEEPVRGG